MKSASSLLGLRKLLLPRPRGGDSKRDLAAAAQASFGSVARKAEARRERDLVEFLGGVGLFAEFERGELARLARSAHERSYVDGERIFEQGTPGVALFVVRSGLVEIRHRHVHGEEVSLAVLEPPASFSEDAAMGAQTLRWASAVARGPVELIGLGSADLNDLARRFPQLTIKILQSIGQITALRLQLLIEDQIFGNEEAAVDEPES